MPLDPALPILSRSAARRAVTLREDVDAAVDGTRRCIQLTLELLRADDRRPRPARHLVAVPPLQG